MTSRSFSVLLSALLLAGVGLEPFAAAQEPVRAGPSEPPPALSALPAGAPPPPPVGPGSIIHDDSSSTTTTGASPDAPPPVPLVAPASPSVPTPRSAGYHDGTFFIHSPDDVFRLYIQGRLHGDWLGQFGPGASKLPPGSGIENGFYLRRARIELAGEFFQMWQWQIGAEFSSSTSIDNAAAQQQTPTCVPSSTGAAPCTNRENPVENATVKPIPTDAFVNFAPSPWANLQVGQFYLPFTLENRISDNTTPFVERSVPVRNIGAPLQRDIGAMFWGESPDRLVYYALALVNGDGPNRENVDARYDWAGRVVVRPAALATSSPTKWAQIGVSAKYGSRSPASVGYDLPSLTTQGGFAFWRPTYRDSLGRTIHIIPSATQWGLAADVFVPISEFDITGEFIYNVYDTREAVDGYAISPFTERTGALLGFGWYAQASYWLVGDHRLLGYPSYGRPIHVDLSRPQTAPRHGLQIVAKFEQLALRYDASSRGGADDPKTPQGDIKVDDVEFGINYWATKHLRVGVNYTHTMFPSARPVAASAGVATQTSNQRAISPAQALAAGVDDPARNGSGTLEEIQARVGVQF